MNETTRSALTLDTLRAGIASRIIDPFCTIEQPTPAEIAEYLRHTNARFASDAIRRDALKARV